MDLQSLRSIAARGLDEDLVHQLEDVARWAWDWGEASGDARFSSLAWSLHQIDSWLTSHEEGGGVPRDLRLDLDTLLKRSLPSILDAASPAEGAVLARHLRSELPAILTGANRWRTDEPSS